MSPPTAAMIALWLRQPSNAALADLHKYRDFRETLDQAIHYEKLSARPRRGVLAKLLEWRDG